MAEWIDPKYADVIEAMRKARAERAGPPVNDPSPVRGFIVPPPPDDH